MSNDEEVASVQSSLAYSTPERLVQDFVSRGLVVLAPESLGIPLEIHDKIYEQEKRALGTSERPTPSSIPEVLDVINSPGVVAACDQLVGENWAIVPFTLNSSFTSGPTAQHWHKDENAPYNSRKQRHHQAVQIQLLYYPQLVREEMGPTVTMPYSHYWTLNHEENQDNFAGAEHLDFDYFVSGMQREPVSGPESKYKKEDIVRGCTAHDDRMRNAVLNLNWPLVQPFEIAPLRAGSVVLYSINTFHRGNHRRDDWRTWQDNPRFMWRFWLYRTTDPPSHGRLAEVNWKDPAVDPLTGIDLGQENADVTAPWRYHHHWIHTGQAPPPQPEALALSAEDREEKAQRLFAQLQAKHDQAEPLRIGSAYELASIGDTALAVRLLEKALDNDRESVRRAATYGLVAIGPDATDTFLKATTSTMKWVRKAGVYGLGDASPLNDVVLQAVVARLRDDPSVYVRSVAAGTLGCLGRRAVATGVGKKLIPACFEALVESLAREENRPAMDLVQERNIKFVRPTDESDVCEGSGIDFDLERFEPVRSAVRENALWSLVILCSHGAEVLDTAWEPTLVALQDVIRTDKNLFCVGFALDALNRLANLHFQNEEAEGLVGDLQTNLWSTLRASPVQSWEALVRGGLSKEALQQF